MILCDTNILIKFYKIHITIKPTFNPKDSSNIRKRLNSISPVSWSFSANFMLMAYIFDHAPNKDFKLFVWEEANYFNNKFAE